MWHLYLLLDIASLSVPFIFSFHPKLRFYKLWNYFFPATFLMMCLFIPWDILFTQNGFWGFNDNYLSGLYLAQLPLEEWLFFICIPYACLFTIYAFKNTMPRFKLSPKNTNVVYFSIQTVLIVGLLYNYHLWYTAINFTYAIVLLAIVFNYKREVLNVFFPVFLLLLVPFFIVNGILTGTGIEKPVVSYNDAENMGVRLLTIPVEDAFFGFELILLNLFLYKRFLNED